MRRILKSVFTGTFLLLLLTSSTSISSSDLTVLKNTAYVVPEVPAANKAAISRMEDQSTAEVASAIYDSLKLKKAGLNQKAFEYAWKGYQRLLKKRVIYRESILSICDFSQSSRRKRLYVIDVESKKLLLNTYVAHGRNSGGEYARSFSNRRESHQSSLGFYLTKNTYFGGHGLALKIEGLEKGFNDNADERNIVMHGSVYVGSDFLKHNRFNGRSFGCPAIPAKQTPKVIHTIKNGTCLFIYHPTKKYLSQSKILNG